MHRTVRLAAAVAGLTLLPAIAALAHPAFNPNDVPVRTAVDTALVIPHGCSTGDDTPEEGEAVATTRVDLQVVDEVTIEPRPVEGWDVAEDGEAIVWTDAGGATTDPIELPVTVTVHDARPGDELVLAVFQECDGGQPYRWTPGSERTPGITLRVTEGEQPAPAATATSEPAASATSEPAAPATSEAAASDTGDGGGSWIPMLVVLLAAAFAVAVAAAAARRRKAT